MANRDFEVIDQLNQLRPSRDGRPVDTGFIQGEPTDQGELTPLDPLLRTPEDIVLTPPPTPEVPPEEKPGAFTELRRGIARGAVDTAALLGPGLLGVIADGLGLDQGSQELFDVVERMQKFGEEEFPTQAPRRVEDIGGVGDFIDFAAAKLGEQVATIASIVATGGVGGGIGQLVGRLAAKGAVSRTAAKSLVTRFATRRTGAAIGAFAGATGIETGATGAELFEATGSANAGVALTAGAIKGSLELLTPLAIIRRFGVGKELGGKFARGLTDAITKGGFVRGAATAALTEGTTEALQETVDLFARNFVDENFELLGPESASRILNAAVTGSLVGGVFGGVGGAFGKRVTDERQDEQSDLERTALEDEDTTPNAPPPAPGEIIPFEELAPGGNEIDAPVAFEDDPAIFEMFNLLGEDTSPVEVDLFDKTTAVQPFDIESELHRPALDVTTPARVEPLIPLHELSVEGLTELVEALEKQQFEDFRAGMGNNTDAARLQELTNRRQEQGGLDPLDAQEFAEKRSFFEQAISVFDPERARVVEVEESSSNTFTPVKARKLLRALKATELYRTTSPDGLADIIARHLSTFTQEDFNQVEAGVIGDGQALGAFVQTKEALGVMMSKFPVLADVRKGLLDAYLNIISPIQDTLHGGRGPNRADLIEAASAVDRIVPLNAGVETVVDAFITSSAASATKRAKDFMESQFDLSGVKYEIDLDGPSVQIAPFTDKPAFLFPDLPEGAEIDSRIKKEMNFVEPKDRAAATKKLKKVQKQYASLLKRFGLEDHTIVLLPHTMHSEGGINYPAFYWNIAQGTKLHFISFDLSGRRFKREESFTAATFHEFGHFLMYTLLANADSQTREAVWNQYLREGIRQPSDARTQKEELAFFGRVTTPDRFVREGADPLGDVERGEFRAPISDSNFDNWWDFDEYLAEQVARWFLSDRRPAITIVHKFFRDIAAKLRTAAKAIFSGSDITFEPNAVVAEFLESVLERRDFKLRPLSQNAMAAGYKSSIEDNVAPLADLSIRQDVPGQGASGNMRRALGAGIFDEETTPAEREKMGAEMDHYNWFVKLGYTILQLADKNQHINGLQTYRETIDLAHNFKMAWISRADNTLKAWKELPTERQGPFSQFLFDLTQMTYLNEGDKARQPTEEEFQALAKKRRLTPDEIELYDTIKGDFDAVLDQIAETRIKEVNQSGLDESSKLIQTSIIRGEMAKLKERPYFPLTRFGKFIVTARNAKGELIFSAQRETKQAADQLVKQIRRDRDFRDATIAQGKLEEQFLSMRGYPPQLLNTLSKRILEETQMTGDQREQFLRTIDALSFEFSPANSFKQRFTERKNILGFSDDAMRSYANYFFHGSNHLMRLHWRPELEASIQDIRASSRKINEAGGDSTKRDQIIDFVNDHFNNFMNPLPDWGTLRSIAFQFHLGMALDSVALNLTQVPMVAWPYLAARFSDGAALGELTSAMKDIRKIYRGKPGEVPDWELAMLERAMTEGFINESQATELAGTSEGNTLQRTLPGSKAGQVVRQAGHWSAFLFQQSEMLNRRLVIRAAIRLAMRFPDAPYLTELQDTNPAQFADLQSQGFTPQQSRAYLAGKDAVRRTMFEYANWARPKFMRGRRGVLFTFFMFSQNMLAFAAHAPGRGRYLALLAATAGLMGLPGAEDLFDVMQTIWRRMGFTDDLRLETRRFVKELGIVDDPDWILHGVSSHSFGLSYAANAMGLPIPTVDFSRRIGLGRLVPGIEGASKVADPLGPQEVSKALGEATEDIAGAAFSIPIQVLKALSDGHPDLYKRWARVLPRSLRNVAKALDVYDNEAVTTRTGADIVKFDVHDPDEMAEIIAMGLGFNPTRVARRWDVQRMQQEAAMYWRVRKSMLLQQFDYAREKKSREGRADARRAVTRYNNEVPFPELKIKGRDLKRSVAERERRRFQVERGRLANKREARLGQDVLEQFPGVEEEIERVRVR